MNVCRKVMEIMKLGVTNIVLKTCYCCCCLNYACAVCDSSATRRRRKKRLYCYNPLPARDIYL